MKQFQPLVGISVSHEIIESFALSTIDNRLNRQNTIDYKIDYVDFQIATKVELFHPE